MQIKPQKLISLKNDLEQMRKEILGSPIQHTTPWKVQTKPTKSRRSFLESLRMRNEKKTKRCRHSLITDYFKTKRAQPEQSIEVAKWGVEDNNFS